MLLYQTGQERAFTILYQRYASRVYGYLRQRLRNQESADEALQAVFIKLHRSKDQFNSTFTFAPWLFTIARTVTLDFHKKQNREAKYVAETRVDPDLFGAQPEPSTATVDLSSLPRTQRSAVEMRYLKDMSFEEIAKRLDTTPNNVRQMISRGVRQLRSMFVKQGIK